MEYEIVKGLEIVDKPSRKYPFGDMEVGDAFVFPRDEKDKVTPAASYYGSRHGGKKFSIRKYASEKYPDGYACKRIA